MPFVRAFNSTCTPIATVIGFSFLLTWVFILYKPSTGPGAIQRLGWQAWELITPPEETTYGSPPSNVTVVTGGANTTDISEEVDWWNVTNTDEQLDSSSLPLDVWAPLLPHKTGCACSNLYSCLTISLSLQYLRLLSRCVL